ncbi:MAG: insulinase family protein [Clostridia bacterium]|nr:insulinase family protein [Clostridia bacterium]
MIYKETLPNGLRIIGEIMENYRSVSIGCWVKAGTVYEELSPAGGSMLDAGTECGISHFIEHMLFKGTEKHSAEELAELMDLLGGNMNAFTSKDCTCFYTKVTDDCMREAVELIAEIVCTSKLNDEDIEREKGVVLEEISMNNDTPEDVVHETLCSLYYGGEALAYPVLGSEASVGAFSRDMLRAYMARRYRPENIVIAAAGNFDFKALRDAVERAFDFGGILGCETVCHEDEQANCACTGGEQKRYELIEKDIEQTHIALAFPGFCYDSEGHFPLLVFNNIVGGSMSSRLFQSIRERSGMAYSVYSSPSYYMDSGYMTLYAGTGEEQAAKVLEMMLKEYEEIRKNGVSEDELERSKRQIKTGYILGRENSSAHASSLGRKELLGRVHRTDDEILSMIDGVSSADIARILPTVCDRSRMKSAIVGRLGKSGAKIEKLLK